MAPTREGQLEDLAARLQAARDHNQWTRWTTAESSYRELLADLDLIDETHLDPDGRLRWDDLAVRARLGLAWSVQMITNSLVEPMNLCDGAEAIAGRSADESLRAVVLAQRAMLHLRSGNPRRALDILNDSLPMVDGADHYNLSIQHLNRGNAHSELGLFEAALQDYQASFDHARELGDPLAISFALQNIGYAQYTLGDLPSALASMEEAERVLPGQEDGLAFLGRAEVLFGSGLLEDAEALLRAAIPQLERAQLRADCAEAEWFHARCLLGLEQYGPAREAAVRAGRRFAEVGVEPMVAFARVLELEAELAQAGRHPERRADLADRAQEALRVADDGDATGSFLGYHPGDAARFVAARWLLLAGEAGRARRIFDDVRRDTPHTPLTSRLQRLVVAAQLAFSEGNRPRGLRAVRQGFRLLAEHRAKLGAVESVTAAAVHGVDLAYVDVGAALRTGRAQPLFDALERGRSTFAGAGRITPPDDPVAAELLTEARGLLAAARELPADVEHMAEREGLISRAGAIQNQVRERAWLRTGDADVARPVTAREVVQVLGGGAVVANFTVFGGRIVVVPVDGTGAKRLDLGPPDEITELIRRVRTDIAMAANEHIPPPLRAAVRASLDRSLKKLDDAVVAPLRADGDLHVVAREPLLGIPWTALPSRQGRRTSVNSHVARGRRDARPGGGHRLLAAAGPGVAHGADEADAVGAEWPGASVLTGAASNTAAVREALATHDVVHLAAHGRHDADNPLFASIELADGPLFAHELDGMRLPASVVVLAACEVGGSSEVVGGEVLGLTSVLLRLGARAVVAAVAPLPDALAAQVMPRFHAHLRATDDPEAALAAACAEVDQPVPLVCFASLPGL
ncbi:CHAT domain-containing protein [Myceligenerans crystallogenes]|uniref:CHAT domain-containing protein n=1 Tax=Myceligenerans crystallogenes TaxID=316335 RepID=A0ABN2N406_9MICO